MILFVYTYKRNVWLHTQWPIKTIYLWAASLVAEEVGKAGGIFTF